MYINGQVYIFVHFLLAKKNAITYKIILHQLILMLYYQRSELHILLYMEETLALKFMGKSFRRCILQITSRAIFVTIL